MPLTEEEKIFIDGQKSALKIMNSNPQVKSVSWAADEKYVAIIDLLLAENEELSLIRVPVGRFVAEAEFVALQAKLDAVKKAWDAYENNEDPDETKYYEALDKLIGGEE